MEGYIQKKEVNYHIPLILNSSLINYHIGFSCHRAFIYDNSKHMIEEVLRFHVLRSLSKIINLSHSPGWKQNALLVVHYDKIF